MFFANGIAMLALAAIAVPIAIHLQKRSRARLVDWAAMRFLTRSLANRRRGLTLEQLLLLLCRCLMIACFVMAMAQPSVKSLTEFRWIFTIAFGLFALVALSMAVVKRTSWMRRGLTLGVAAAFGIIAAAATWLGGDTLIETAGQPRDVAIVIDVSSSEKLTPGGETAFAKNIEAAQLLVNELPGGSTVSLTMADAVMSASSPPNKNLSAAAEKLKGLQPVGGGSNLSLAIERARSAIEKGPNTQKQVVVFADDQLRAWQQAADGVRLPSAESKASVEASEDEVAVDVDSPELFGHLVSLPRDIRDVSISSMELDSEMIGVGQPVRLRVALFNGGSTMVSDLGLELLRDGQVIDAAPPIQIESQSHTVARFSMRFDKPGWHTLTARIPTDDLADGNEFHHVVRVFEGLPVLIINGNPSAHLLDRSATFAQLALDPASLVQEGQDDQNQASKQGWMHVDTLDVSALNDVQDLAAYKVILLCNVPRLSTEMASRLSDFVTAGGGLFVVLGDRCEAEFYNEWTLPDKSTPVISARLGERKTLDLAKSLTVDPDSVTHPTLARLIETGEHDLTELKATAYWQLRDQPGSQAPVGMRFTNGDPLLCEHTLGQGKVLTFALSLNALENNFISRVSFPVMMHLWVQYLASADQLDLNLAPQRDLALELSPDDLPGIETHPLMLTLPDGTQLELATSKLTSESGKRWTVSVGQAAMPGLYRLECSSTPEGSTLPFVIQFDAEEFNLTAASPDKLKELGAQFNISWIENVTQLRLLGRGVPKSVRLWKHFAVAALLLVVVEVVVVRWVNARRRVPGDSLQPADASKATNLKQDRSGANMSAAMATSYRPAVAEVAE